MGIITSIRATLPVAESLASGALDITSPGHAPCSTAGPVATTIQTHAVQQASQKTASGDAQLLEARMATEISAAQAAEAARDAYIKASIAAGISPLPLP